MQHVLADPPVDRRGAPLPQDQVLTAAVTPTVAGRPCFDGTAPLPACTDHRCDQDDEPGQYDSADDGVRVHDSPPYRSEEHTSELQSRGHLVCRLLLEKKKKNQLAQ